MTTLKDKIVDILHAYEDRDMLDPVEAVKDVDEVAQEIIDEIGYAFNRMID